MPCVLDKVCLSLGPAQLRLDNKHESGSAPDRDDGYKEPPFVFWTKHTVYLRGAKERIARREEKKEGK